MDKYLIIQQKLINVQKENEQTKLENIGLKNELLSLKKNTSKHDIRVIELQKLYNITTSTGRKLTEMETNTHDLILQLEHNRTMTMNEMQQGLDNQLPSFKTSNNATIHELQTKTVSMLNQISEKSEQGMINHIFVLQLDVHEVPILFSKAINLQKNIIDCSSCNHLSCERSCTFCHSSQKHEILFVRQLLYWTRLTMLIQQRPINSF